jgi:tetratricopeptide (TPR) repeat protein
VAEALRLDPRNTAAMIVEGLLLPPTDWIGRERIWRRAATARATDAGYEHAQLGLLLLQTGRIEEAIAALRRGVVADPVYPGLSLTLAYAYRLAGRDAEAERVYDRVQDLWPESGTLQFRFWRDAVTDGQFDTARTAARAFASAAGVPPALIEEATRSIEAGRPFDPELARQVREDPAPTQEEAVTVTTAQLLTGDIGAALATIAAVHDRVDVPVTHMLFDPAMQAHWGTPRFAAVVEQLGLGAYWRTNGPPDLCRAADRPAACRNWAPPAARPA